MKAIYLIPILALFLLFYTPSTPAQEPPNFGYGSYDLLLSQDGSTLISRNYRRDRGYILDRWDVRTHHKLPSLEYPWRPDAAGQNYLESTTISFDGRFITCRHPDQGVLIFDTVTNTNKRILENQKIFTLRFLPALHRLLIVGEKLWRYDIDHGTTASTALSMHFQPPAGAYISPDGQYLLRVEGCGVSVLDLTSPSKPLKSRIIPPLRDDANLYLYGESAHGNMVALQQGSVEPMGLTEGAYYTVTHGLFVLDLKGMSFRRIKMDDYPYTYALTPGGREIAISNRRELRLFSTKTLQPTRRIAVDPSEWVDMIFTPDAKTIIVRDTSLQIRWIQVPKQATSP